MPEWLIILFVAIMSGTAAYWLGQRRPDEDPFEEQGYSDEERAEFSVHCSYDILVATLETGVICIDPYDIVAAANPAAVKLFSSSAERMVGRATIEATSSIEIDRRVAAARKGEASRAQIEVATSRLMQIVDLWVEPLPGGGALVILDDVTALREHERTRREFLGNISHELRTPLAGIKLMFETLEAVDDQPTREHFYPQIRAEIDRLGEIVEHLLDVARAEGGRLDLKRDPLALNELAQDALIPIEQRVCEREIAFFTDLQPAHIVGDAARLRQVLGNLVENALRHTPPGGSITLRTRTEGQNAILEVEDTGIGIPFKDLPHIFERFYVVDRSRAKVNGGLGLGLALVKATVEAHAGKISVVSELGGGARFTAVFPSR
jgi:two-component system phosphate regulon sensor histidine kinase PhoR